MAARDHFIAAAALVALFMEEAPMCARMRADAALAQGDAEGFIFWETVKTVLRRGDS